MLKQHQISRMFMCRCCNWAFPDKTSLHVSACVCTVKSHCDDRVIYITQSQDEDSKSQKLRGVMKPQSMNTS